MQPASDIRPRSFWAISPAEADIGLYGSFATTGKGHGTDRALVAGLLGLRPDDPRLPDSFALAEEAGHEVHASIRWSSAAAHPNTAVLTLKSRTGRALVHEGGVGGRRTHPRHRDRRRARRLWRRQQHPDHPQRGHPRLHRRGDHCRWRMRRINIASMQVFRAATGGYAVMVLECDSHIPHALEQQLAVMPGILQGHLPERRRAGRKCGGMSRVVFIL